MEFQVYGNIIANDDSDMITILTWFKDTYGTKIHSAQAMWTTKNVSFSIIETVFNDAVDAMINIRTNYLAKLEKLNLGMSD